jgi:hypothetical protein
MDDAARIATLKTPAECIQFQQNVVQRGRPDLALAAQRKAVELRALQYAGTAASKLTEIERECIEAIFAYEDVLSAANGKRTRATRTWQMIARHGILGAVERAVGREADPSGYTALVSMGLEHYAFEAVIVRHPGMFSEAAIARSKERLARNTGTGEPAPVKAA